MTLDGFFLGREDVEALSQSGLKDVGEGRVVLFGVSLGGAQQQRVKGDLNDRVRPSRKGCQVRSQEFADERRRALRRFGQVRVERRVEIRREREGAAAGPVAKHGVILKVVKAESSAGAHFPSGLQGAARARVWSGGYVPTPRRLAGTEGYAGAIVGGV